MTTERLLPSAIVALTNVTTNAAESVKADKTVNVGDEAPARNPQEPFSKRHARPLKVMIAGGGPTGMVLALTLFSYLGPNVQIQIFDPRWMRQADGCVAWRNVAEGNRRRRQVVTLQSNVYGALPSEVRDALFADGEFSEMWPYGPDSPEWRGRPRNVPIRLIEDRLLTSLQRIPSLALIPQGYVPAAAEPGAVVAICDGSRSPTREHFIESFGTPHPDFYSLDGVKLRETVLGMEFEGGVPDGEGVLLTVAQNRLLLNSFKGRGFLNMRLTGDEAAELVGLGEFGPATCMQSQPCSMVRQRGQLSCTTHASLFKPSVDSSSYLWPRLLEGLRLFGLDAENLVSITAFNFELAHRPRFVAPLPNGMWGCLLGDAANSIHFWPGRGLNSGIKSALSLARTLARRWRGARLRESDLCEHEGVMQMLQNREIANRAWRIMQMLDESGRPRPIEQRIQAGLSGPCDRAEHRRILLDRLQVIRARLTGRMGELPNDALLEGRLAALSPRTLKVLVETGPWITEEVGGPEVDVEGLLPLT